jgi:tight adherence protein B
MRRLLALAAGALLLATVPLATAGAEGNDDSLAIDAVDVGDHPDVRVSVTAPGDLAPDDVTTAFTVLEDGEERPVEGRLASSADLQVILAIDTSGSMGGPPIVAARDAAAAFLKTLPGDVALAIHEYATVPSVVTDFDASRRQHARGIAALEAEGNTAMFDAVVEAVEAFPEANGDTRRAIVLLTDGEDNESTADLAVVTELLVAEGVSLHGVEYQTSSSDPESLHAVTEASGGSVYKTDDADALGRIYEQLARDLVNRYSLVYTSESSGEVELTVALTADGTTSTATRTVELPEPPAEAGDDGAAAVPPGSSDGSGRTWLATTGLVAGAVLWFLALALLTLTLFVPGERRAQLAGAARHGTGTHRTLGEVTDRVTLVAEHALQNRGYERGLNAALERAGLDLRPGEFVVLVASAGVTALALGVALSGWLAGVLLSVVAVLVARLAVSFLASRRQSRFAEQLSDTLQLLSGSLRAGYSMLQAVDAVAREADSPTSEEFGRLVVETRLGRDMNEALDAMADRMDSEDFRWVAQAIEIHREVGGDLAEVLDTVAGTIRERDQIRRQVKALSAEGRLSAYVLLALPFGVGFMIFLTNPGYLAELTQGGLLGWGLIALGLVLMTIGVIWMRKLVRLVF